jgi:hypothetical protein
VSDIFREVEEEVRQERLQKWWKKYGDYVIAGISAIAITVAGYKLWQHYQEQQRLKASSQYQSATQLLTTGQYDLATQAYAQIAKNSPSGYSHLARLSQADSLLAQGKTDEAVAVYTALMNDDKAGIGEVARIRAAWAQADTKSTNDLRTLLAPINDDKSGWRFMAREILAYRTYRDGKTKEAQKEFETLASSADAPASLRQRAAAMATLIRTSGGENFGTVPPPVPPKPVAPAQQGTPSP